MTVNPINVNTQGIGTSYGYGTQSKAKNEETKEKEQTGATSKKTPVAADDVLSYMAQSAVAVAPAKTKTINPAKYVDEKSAERIAGFIAQFEDKVAEGLANFDKEFAGVDMSDSSKMAVVLAGINKDA